MGNAAAVARIVITLVAFFNSTAHYFWHFLINFGKLRVEIVYAMLFGLCCLGGGANSHEWGQATFLLVGLISPARLSSACAGCGSRSCTGAFVSIPGGRTRLGPRRLFYFL